MLEERDVEVAWRTDLVVYNVLVMRPFHFSETEELPVLGSRDKMASVKLAKVYPQNS